MSAFRGRATGGSPAPTAEATAIAAALAVLIEPGENVELRVLPGGRSFVAKGSDVISLIGFVNRQDDYKGIYYTLNPVRVGLDGAAKNEDILRRRWLLVDVDAQREPDTNSTEREHEKARLLAYKIMGDLLGEGWPMPVVIDSGNGWHLLYRIDLPHDELSRTICREALKALAKRFDNDDAKVDRSVHNASRISKLPGTWARKGPNTPERPHRLCRLVSSIHGMLPVEKLQKLIGPPEPEKPPEPPEPTHETPKTVPVVTASPFRGRAHGESSAAYVLAALAAEVKSVRHAAKLNRNNTLNVAAFSLGQFIPGGHLTREQIEAALIEAALAIGLGEEETRRTIESGIDSGKQFPRVIPEPASKGKAPPQRPPVDPSIPLTVKMSRVTPLVVEWLMPNRIPKRFITVLAGQTGIGKSFVACDLIARISRGGEIPFSEGKTFPVGGTLIISEDSHEYVLAPRLIDAGADMSRIHAMTWAAMGQYHLSDVEMLERAANEVDGGVSVVMIDPPTNFLEGTDEHKNAEVRQLVMKIVEWALGRDIAVLFILHVNKNAKGVDALNRVMGSVAWVTTARIAHTFCPDPDDRDRGLWAPLKSNLGPIGKAIAFKIAKVDGGTVVQWLEEVDITANAAMSQEQSNKPRKVQASVFLEEMFTDRIEIPSNDIWKAREKTNVSKNALLEAKDEMGIVAQHLHDTDGTQRWLWRWSDEARTNWLLKKEVSDSKAAAKAADRESGARF